MQTTISGERSRYGLAVSALGAVLLAVAVFLPWYGISLTPAGAAAARHEAPHVKQRYGNALPRSPGGVLAARRPSGAGREISSLSAHRVLHVLNIVLLVIAGLALLDVLLPLARGAAPLPGGAGGSVVLLGTVAALLVSYRMLHPPTPAGALLSLSLREGCWLALLGALALALGGMWPRANLPEGPDEDALQSPWAVLSGWTAGEQR